MELFEENHFKQYLLIFSNYATVFLMCKKYAEAYYNAAFSWLVMIL